MSKISVRIYENCKHGRFAHLASDEIIGFSLGKYGEWGEHEIDILSRYIPTGGTVLDVGANIGTHSLAFARLVGAEGTVVAIEGNPVTFGLLSHNVIANDLAGRVLPIMMLAGTQPGIIYVPLHPTATDNLGAKSFRNAAYGERQPETASVQGVPMCPVDSLNLSRCDLIKIDVEGMEPEVLAGCRASIEKHHPVVYFEFAARDLNILKRSFDILSECGYDLRYHYANPYSQNNFRSDPENAFAGTMELNILACPHGADAPQYLPRVTIPLEIPEKPAIRDALKGETISDYLAGRK